MVCKKCGAKLSDNAQFCSACGEKVNCECCCPNCGKKLWPGSVFCPFCGAECKEPTSSHSSTSDVIAENTCNAGEAEIGETGEILPQSNIYHQIKIYEQQGREANPEYKVLLKREKSVYFWWKLLLFGVYISFALIIGCIFSEIGLLQKIIGVCLCSMVFSIVYLLTASRMSKAAGLKSSVKLRAFFSDADASSEEAEMEAGLSYLNSCIGERHARAIKIVGIISIITFSLAALYFFSLLHQGTGFVPSLDQSLTLFVGYMVIIYAFWTFKFGALLLPLFVGVILAMMGRTWEIIPFLAKQEKDTATSNITEPAGVHTGKTESHAKNNTDSLANFVGDYSYDASFDNPDGTWTNFFYSLEILQATDGINVSLEWRGLRIFSDVYINNDTTIDGNTINFYVDDYQTDYEPGYHSLTYIPAIQSPYSSDTIYVDGDTDMPFTKDGYVDNSYSYWDDSYSDSYILPTDTQYITESDLYGMSKEQVSLARNEIYARYGYSFKNADIRSYFMQQSWYYENPSVNADTFGISNLSDCERANLETIQQYERDMGWK